MAEGEVHVLRDDSGTGSPCLFRYLKLLLRLPAEQPQSCRSGELRPWEGEAAESRATAAEAARPGAAGFTGA